MDNLKLAVVGLGYVGLPLAVEFGKHRPVVGFDINARRIRALQDGHDSTLEVSDEELAEAGGLTFKENCPDLRNTRVVDVVKELAEYNVRVDVYDPWINPDEAHHEYGIQPIEAPRDGDYDGIVLAVGHRQFKDMGADAIRRLGRDDHVLYDLKYILPKEAVDLRL